MWRILPMFDRHLFAIVNFVRNGIVFTGSDVQKLPDGKPIVKRLAVNLLNARCCIGNRTEPVKQEMQKSLTNVSAEAQHFDSIPVNRGGLVDNRMKRPQNAATTGKLPTLAVGRIYQALSFGLWTTPSSSSHAYYCPGAN
jgi:hypothetical protein